MSFMELAAAIGVACGTGVGVITLLEKITGAGSRWLAKGVEAGTQSLRADVNDVRDEQREIRHLTRFHLGPNGTSTPVHERLKRVEAALEAQRVGNELSRDDPAAFLKKCQEEA